jgi:hypothetical protein
MTIIIVCIPRTRLCVYAEGKVGILLCMIVYLYAGSKTRSTITRVHNGT